MTDTDRLTVIAELYAEAESGLRPVPLYVAAQRYEARVRERMRDGWREPEDTED
jgi:hypothetical protein